MQKKLLRSARRYHERAADWQCGGPTFLIPQRSSGRPSSAALATSHTRPCLFRHHYYVTQSPSLFAGASLSRDSEPVPRYLPRYGMAPEWTRASRPLVVLFTAITFLITVIFNADVEAQGGAYATGVLVLMTSAAVAVTLALWKRRSRAWMFFALITLVFVYTTVTNVIERPDGVKIAAWFIVTIVVHSLHECFVDELRVREGFRSADGKFLIESLMRDRSLRMATKRVPDSRQLRDTGIASLQRDTGAVVEVRHQDASAFSTAEG